ncbi:YadA-like family protein [Qipengyuania sp. GH1]|uniref:YadA-like family protein n=1 Tax=Qipengyuania aestuarii TaxID=2867241 RepID=UPI001C86DF88|nr:YadA-like family protein [Qipengyuania aestuarii]MBX7536491.1 YadA-like family protein [Qipengyuania aestuarii]
MMNSKTGRASGIGALRIAALATVATSAFTLPGLENEAHAQALAPVADVCTGLSLNESQLTNLLGAVNQPIVTPIQGTVNGVLDILAVVDSALPVTLGTLADLNIDVTTIVDDAVAGNPVSVQLVDSSGTVLGAGECNLAADAYTLNTQSGIQIGGNQISGLGANGQAASAGELDAIAFGNNASTAAGATGAIALGTNAFVTAPNSVALGADSVADRANTVSVGAAGAERQITNVAAGTAPTDAATVGQVDTAIAAATGNSVQYDGAGQTSVTLAGAGGTTVTNVADGALSATSSDAVNGSQLFATNQDVAANAGDISALDGRVTANDADIASLDGRVTTNESDIASLDGRVTTNETDIADLQALGVQYDDASQGTITLGGADGTIVTNVAPGALNATSTDAVNGAQLFATNQAVGALDTRVTQNEVDIATNTADIAALQVTTGGFDTRITQNENDIAALDGRVTTNEADIATLDGRVTTNETDIANLDGRVTTNETDIANLDGRVTTNEGDIANLDGRVTVNEGDIASLDGRVTTNEGDITNLDTRVTTAEGNISSIDSRVTVNEGSIVSIQAQLANVPVTYVSDADGTTPSATPTDTVAFQSASGGAARVTNVAAGALTATSTDAVNGSQLFETNGQVAQNASDITTVRNNLQGSTVVAVQYSDPDNPNVSNGGTITNDVALVGADFSAPVVLHNVANGTLANDAANIGQLQAGLADVMATSMGYTDTRVMEAMAYTDMRVADLTFDLADLRDDAFAGTAAAMAMSAIPQSVDPSKSTIGGGVGHYRGETAFGFGYSGLTGDGKMSFNVRGTIDTHGKGGVAAGAGFHF